MDIYLTNLSTNEKVRIPMLPEEIGITSGTSFASYDIAKLGEVKIPFGNALKEIVWEAMLPGKALSNYPFIRAYVEPKDIYIKLESWRRKGCKLRLLITETPINDDVYINEFEATLKGAFGSYEYKISCIEARDIVIESHYEKLNLFTFPKPQPKPKPRPAPAPSKTYTVVNGDCLWNIAIRFYGNGTQYTKIYDTNKDLIERTAKSRGFASSSHGHWIFPGEVLAIP